LIYLLAMNHSSHAYAPSPFNSHTMSEEQRQQLLPAASGEQDWKSGLFSCFEGSNCLPLIAGCLVPFCVFGSNYKSLKESNKDGNTKIEEPKVEFLDSLIGCCPCSHFYKACIPHAIPTLVVIPFNFWTPGISGPGLYALQYGLMAMALIPIGFEFCLRRSIRKHTLKDKEGGGCMDCVAVFFCQAFALMQEYSHLKKIKDVKEAAAANMTEATAPPTISRMPSSSFRDTGVQPRY